ncbi:MAG: TonB-dependent receptor [Micropepsaceae bacterium]
MRKSVLCSASFIALSAALAFNAMAEETKSDEEVVVTASRARPVPKKQYGGSATFVSAEDLNLRQTRIVSDILRDIPGVAVNRSGGAGGITQIRLRGSEANHTLVLIDGIEASDPYQGEFDFATLIADDVASIEVLRGQQSALYGSDAIGGVISYRTASGREAPGLRGRIEGGSFSSFDSALRFGGYEGGLDYALSAAYNSTEGTPTARFGSRDVGGKNLSLAGRFVYEASERLTLRLIGRYSRTEADSNPQLYAPADPLNGFVVDGDGTYQNKAFYGLAGVDYALLDGAWTHSLNLQGVDSERDTYQFGAQDYSFKGSRVKASYVTAYAFGTDDLKHTVTGAIDWKRETFRNTTPYYSGDVVEKRTLDNTGFVASYDLLAGDAFGFGASVRYDENDIFRNATTWRVQASYAFAGGTRLHAAGGSGIKAPGVFELWGFFPSFFISNPDLKAERSVGWEAGVEQTFLNGDAKIDVTYFSNTLEDEIATVGFPSTPVNLATDSEQQGVEVSVQALIDANWRVFASYTWLDAKQNGIEEARRPEHSGSLNLSYLADGDAWSATLTVRYNGRMTDSNFTNFGPYPAVLDSFTLVNLGGDVRISDSVRAYARVENLTDATYEEVYTFATPGRAFYAGIKAGF